MNLTIFAGHENRKQVARKKRVKFTKYQTFKHTTESKKKNMVGSNPEVNKRKALHQALNPVYVTDSTVSAEYSFQYSSVPGNPDQEKAGE